MYDVLHMRNLEDTIGVISSIKLKNDRQWLKGAETKRQTMIPKDTTQKTKD
jgi:hypothetical protein